MTVYRVHTSSHSFLARALHLLSSTQLPTHRALRASDGDLTTHLAGPTPVEDRDLSRIGVYASMSTLQVQLYNEAPPDMGVRAAIYYPPGGGMGWHTNSKKPGWRIYVPLVPDNADSGIVTQSGRFVDRPGFANVFRIDPDYTKSWHGVWANTARMSVGIWVADDHPLVAGLAP